MCVEGLRLLQVTCILHHEHPEMRPKYYEPMVAKLLLQVCEAVASLHRSTQFISCSPDDGEGNAAFETPHALRSKKRAKCESVARRVV